MIGARVSIVVLTFNRRDELLRTLSELARVDESVRIVVADNASTDGTADAIAEHYPRVDVVRLPHNVGAAGRNAGARACTTPYIAFCDDDTWWTPQSLDCAAGVLDRYRTLASVTARVIVGDDHHDDPTNARMAASPLPNTLGLPGTELVGLLGGACMVRRDAFLAVGGYDPHLFLGCEEALLAVDLMSAGWRMAYVPQAIVHHDPSRARDIGARHRLMLRNALWLAWLRRPWPRAIAATRSWLAESLRDGELGRSTLDALRGAPWIVRGRRVVPPHVEHALRTIEAFYGAEPSVARRRVETSPAKAG